MCDDNDIATNDFDLDYTITATNTVPCTELLAEYNSALTSENSYEGLFIFFLLVTIGLAILAAGFLGAYRRSLHRLKNKEGINGLMQNDYHGQL
jgi:hypothetical protein